MSVSGLYESKIGDALARKTLASFRHIDDSEIDDEIPRPGGRPTFRRCRCGNPVARPYIKRGDVYVCKACAEKIPRRFVGGPPISHSCAGCGAVVSRTQLVQRRGKLYCKHCQDKV